MNRQPDTFARAIATNRKAIEAMRRQVSTGQFGKLKTQQKAEFCEACLIMSEKHLSVAEQMLAEVRKYEKRMQEAQAALAEAQAVGII